MVVSLDSKLNVIMNALASLSRKTIEIEGVMTGLHNDGAYVITLYRVYKAQNSEVATLPSI